MSFSTTISQTRLLPFALARSYIAYLASTHLGIVARDHDLVVRLNPRLHQHSCSFLISTSFARFQSDIGIYNQVIRDYFLVSNVLPWSQFRVIFDVGANIGMFSLISATICSLGTIHAFEPLPYAIAKIEKNRELNELANIVINASAVSDIIGMIKLSVIFNGTQASLNPSLVHEPDLSRVDASTVTLDGYVKQHSIDHIDMLKIDVEGAEYLVLRGGLKTLQITKYVLIEYHSPALKAQCGAILQASGLRPVYQSTVSSTVGISLYTR